MRGFQGKRKVIADGLFVDDAFDLSGSPETLLAPRVALAQAQSLFNQAQQTITSTAQQIVATTMPATDAITNAFEVTYDLIQNGAELLYHTLVGGSVWPDTMDTMQAITDMAMKKIQDAVRKSFTDVCTQAGNAFSIMQGYAQQIAAMPTALGGGGAGVNLAGMVWPEVGALGSVGPQLLSAMAANPYQSQYSGLNAHNIFGVPVSATAFVAGNTPNPYITVPVSMTVQVDGATVAKTVETRMIQQAQACGGY